MKPSRTSHDSFCSTFYVSRNFEETALYQLEGRVVNLLYIFFSTYPSKFQKCPFDSQALLEHKSLRIKVSCIEFFLVIPLYKCSTDCRVWHQNRFRFQELSRYSYNQILIHLFSMFYWKLYSSLNEIVFYCLALIYICDIISSVVLSHVLLENTHVHGLFNNCCLKEWRCTILLTLN